MAPRAKTPAADGPPRCSLPVRRVVFPRRFSALTAALCAGVVSCGGATADNPVAPEYGAVHGAVKSSLGDLLGNAQIALVTAEGVRLAGTSDSATGEYAIANVPIGSGEVTVQASHPLESCSDVSVHYEGLAYRSAVTVDVVVPCVSIMGTLRGVVTSYYGALVAGTLVTVTPNGALDEPAQGPLTAVTSDSGAYVVPNVPTGPYGGTIALSNLPLHCHDSGTHYLGLVASQTRTVNITVPCDAYGAVSGTVTRSYGGPVAAATVTLTPTGFASPPAALTDSLGVYTFPSVPVGDGTGMVAVAGLPARCTPASATYAGLKNGTTVTANVAIPCQAPDTIVRSCRTLQDPGSYTVVADPAAASAACIIIAADNVSLNCAGHRIASASQAIYAVQVKHVRIDDCNLSGYLSAQYFDRAALVISHDVDVAVRHSTVTGFTPIYVDSSSAVVLDSNIILPAVDFGYGVVLLGGHDNRMHHNAITGTYPGRNVPSIAYGADDGILLYEESADTISDNAIANVFDAGIESVGALSATVITGNRVDNAGFTAIGSWYGTSWTGNRVAGNTISNAPALLYVDYETDADLQFARLDTIRFVGTAIVGNTLTSRVALPPNAGAVEASIVVDFGSLAEGPSPLPLPRNVSGDTVADNELPSQIAQTYLVPASGFVLVGTQNLAPAGGAFPLLLPGGRTSRLLPAPSVPHLHLPVHPRRKAP